MPESRSCFCFAIRYVFSIPLLPWAPISTWLFLFSCIWTRCPNRTVRTLVGEIFKISFYLFFKHQKHFVLGYSQLTILWLFQVNSEGTHPEEGETGLLLTLVPWAPSAVPRLINTCFFLVQKMMNDGGWQRCKDNSVGPGSRRWGSSQLTSPGFSLLICIIHVCAKVSNFSICTILCFDYHSNNRVIGQMT